MLRLLDLTLPTPEEKLALDEALLHGLERASASDGSNVEETLRFWESPVPFVVVGSSGRLREEVDLEACRTARVPVLRRASAGGSVLQAPGCLNFALVLSLDARPQLRDVGESYRTIIGRLAGALALDDAEFRGTSD